MWLQDQKEKGQEKNHKEEKGQKEGQEEKEIIHPRMFLAGFQVSQLISSCNHVSRPIVY
jgi:hypothetical protein